MPAWRIAKYLRLSSEDRDVGGNLKSESESIGGQRKLIEQYIARTPAFCDAEVFEFCDDGYSGTSFDRPAMQRLLTAARKGEINCIVVKDLSRFGRNYIEVGNFLEKVLPFLGVRFVSVNDAYDSKDPRCIGGLDTAFKNLLNDLYSRDCSVKVKNGKRTTALQGKYQNPWAPFGYVKSAQERGKLEPDLEAAEIVRRIFVLFLDGRGTVEVARILNRDNVPTKSAYRAAQGDKMRWQYAGERNYWDAAAVRGILTDRRYIGSVVYGKRQAKGIAAHRNIKAPPEKLVEVEDCHEPLVSREDFQRAQALLGTGQHYGKSVRPLAGKVKCGVCGHAMPLRKAKEPYFTCGTKWYDSDYSCGEMQYPQETLFEVLRQALGQQIELRVERETLQQVEIEKWEQQRAALEQELSDLERQLVRGKEQMRARFEQFAAGELAEADFSTFQRNNKWQAAQQTQKITAIQLQMAELGEKGKDCKPISLIAGRKDTIINRNGVEVSPELLDGFVREERLYPDATIEISWEFDED